MARASAFTLVELILVMALLCVILAVAAPSLSRSIHQRNLTQEATRLLSLTEYARDEAVSRGVPMDVWINVATGQYGVQAMPGYEDSGARGKVFTLIPGLRFDLLGGPVARAAQSGAANATQGNTANRPAAATTRLPSAAGQSDVAEFLPDGTLDPSSEASVRLVDQSNAAIDVTQNKDGSAYEIEKEIP